MLYIYLGYSQYQSKVQQKKNGRSEQEISRFMNKNRVGWKMFNLNFYSDVSFLVHVNLQLIFLMSSGFVYQMKSNQIPLLFLNKILVFNSINKRYIHLSFLEFLFVIHQDYCLSNVDDPKQFKLETNQTRLKAHADNVTIRC